MIAFSDIEKSFFGVPVLKGVRFVVPPGETVGLVGENGAGKSTLMNILGGNLAADAGEMRMAGRPYSPRSPRDAEREGIAFIHQELNLFPNLSIAENIFIGRFPRRFSGLPWIDCRTMRESTVRVLREVDLGHSPDEPVESLSTGERQLVEIAKALSQDARLIIFDEPTTSLTARETGRLFELIGRLRRRHISIIYISHSLGHVMDLCDRVVVMRDGAVVGQGMTSRPISAAESLPQGKRPPAEERREWKAAAPGTVVSADGLESGRLTLDRMVSLMVGREITQFFPNPGPKPKKDPMLEVRRVSRRGMARNISFHLHRGEVLGIAGLMGSGRSELARILFGLDPVDTGEIRLDGLELSALSPRERIRVGLAFLTEDRRGDGLCMEASIFENAGMAALRRYSLRGSGWMDSGRLRDAIHSMMSAVRLTASARDEQPVKTLSGGNQQKVVLAKWLLNQPKVLILDEPTRGIDVGAKTEVYELIHTLSSRGAGILMISSEVEELVGMCHRILVMNRGGICDEMERPEFDRERILRSALHDAPVATSTVEKPFRHG